MSTKIIWIQMNECPTGEENTNETGSTVILPGFEPSGEGIDVAGIQRRWELGFGPANKDVAQAWPCSTRSRFFRRGRSILPSRPHISLVPASFRNGRTA